MHLVKVNFHKQSNYVRSFLKGGSPGLVVMGGDSCPEGCGFKSQRCLLNGHFFIYVVVKFVMCV